MIEEIVREQVDLVLLAVSLRQEIEEALAARDRERFERIVPLYLEVSRRCLWDL